MLVLSRKVGERILIGDAIAITIVKVGQGGVRVGVEAPADYPVVREELAQQIAAQLEADQNERIAGSERDSPDRAEPK